ncbi:LppA family lipoprotein [Saccharomonospora glauca]|uniref:Uncharacterized protein n=1 Tax=Saccharomonospora glauca K62 TaxID=928724 RepID=I1D2K8_9PSEU|nr:LppA family lipoprotein [Saccharomonospora glauca]EIE99182.1 hypothetical protein SacglDRAFT_02286 [Saccharomonospora glauca K62]
MNPLFDELLGRPDIETVQRDYLALLDLIRDRLVSDFGIAPFVLDAAEPVTGSACPGEFSTVREAEVRHIAASRSPGNLPDEAWPRAVELVTELAAEKGFTDPRTVVDRPGDHEVALYDQYGAELIFGTAKNTIISLSTGCHLTSEAHRRGTPAPEEPLY